MALPNIDTFEHDIAEEIKRKDAAVSAIASAGGEVSNTELPKPQEPKMLIIGGIFAVITMLGIAFAFYYKTAVINPQQEAQITTPEPVIETPKVSLSPTIEAAIGDKIRTISQSEYGYTFSITEYTPVFAYMIKSEDLYADELAFAVGSPREVGTSSTPFTFSDLTLNNQNMRIGTSGSSTVIYAFINTETIVVASSTDAILSLRSAILK